MAFGRETIRIDSYDGQTITLPQPSFGYTVELRKAVNIQRFEQNVSTFDRGIEFDQRRCAFKLLVEPEQITSAGNLFSRRGQEIDKYKIISGNARGFSPAGPDRGGTGSGAGGSTTHIFSLIDNPKYTQMLTNPFGLYEMDLNILIHDAPYRDILPAAKDFLGDFTFGNVTGIRNPKMSPVQEQAISRTVTMGGENYAIASATNEFICNMTITTTAGKMAEIINFIQNERGEGFDIKGGVNYYPWGGHQKGGAVTHRVKLLNSNFIMTHVAPDLWELPVQLWRVADKHVFPGADLPEIELPPTVTPPSGAVKVGNLYWSAKNIDINIPGSVAPNRDENNVPAHGRLYTYDMAKEIESRMADEGWRLPTENDFREMIQWVAETFHHGNTSSFGIPDSLIKQGEIWQWYGNGDTDFNAVPAGFVGAGGLTTFGGVAWFWLSDSHTAGQASLFIVMPREEYIISENMGSASKDYMLSVRLVWSET